jgi:hypothetical protein
MKLFLLAAAAASLLLAQRLQLNLDHLAKKAAKTENVDLDSSMLQAAGNFLDDKGKDEKNVMGMVKGIQGIQVRSFKFDKPGEFTEADIEQIRSQLRGPGWSRIVSEYDRKSGKIEEVCLHRTGDKVDGLVVLDVKPTKLEVVNIVGSVDLGKLKEVGKQKPQEQ